LSDGRSGMARQHEGSMEAVWAAGYHVRHRRAL
jgi:hypothetical protein